MLTDLAFVKQKQNNYWYIKTSVLNEIQNKQKTLPDIKSTYLVQSAQHIFYQVVHKTVFMINFTQSRRFWYKNNW